MKMKSVMQHSFSQIPDANIQRSSFNRSHGLKTTFDAGYLVPVYVDEVLPGDTFNLQMAAFARLATPITPLMDNMYLDSFFFFVPTRLVWDNWEKFNGQQTDPGDSTDYEIPIVSPVAAFAENSLGDYFGLPVGAPFGAVPIQYNVLPFRCYGLIWNEWFRDQNLQDSVVVDTGDGPDTTTNLSVLRRGKRHDYFTSALPWPQKGPAVELPLGSRANISGLGLLDTASGMGSQANLNETGTTTGTTYTFAIGTNAASGVFARTTAAGPDATLDVYADLSSATAATINQLRQAFQIQRMYERDARGGTRYTEIIRSHFGVTSPDARLQRPEYLGGGSTPVNIHPVPQTSSTDATTPQGNLAAYGTAAVTKGHSFSKSFTEHGYIIGLVSVRADLTYQRNVNRMWSRSTRFDFYWPALSHLGEQAILNKEIYPQNAAADDEVFGYQERYAEYRYKPSLITGLFRSDVTGSLDYWHLAQDFDSLPLLNESFIVENPPIDRVIATPTEPHFLFDAYFALTTARPMPTYSVPGLIDHL